MPTFTMTKGWADTEPLTEAELDGIKNSVETFLNITKLDNSNIQTGGIATANLADACVTAAKLAAAVAGDGLTGGAGSALAVNPDNSTLEINTDAVRVKDGGITQAKLAARATGTTVAAGGVAISASCGAFTISSTSFADVTNLSVTITTTGRPVVLQLISDGNGTNDAAIEDNGTSTQLSRIKLLRGSTVIGTYQVKDATLQVQAQMFAGGIAHLDPVAAGTYTYKLQARGGSTSTLSISYCKLVAYEV